MTNDGEFEPACCGDVAELEHAVANSAAARPSETARPDCLTVLTMSWIAFFLESFPCLVRRFRQR
jgi:hypothetical protein